MYQPIETSSLVLICLLLTVALPGQTKTDDRWRHGVRWGTLGLISLRSGLILSSALPARESYQRVIHLIVIEVPATWAMLWYLARVARLELRPDIQRTLRRWAWVSASLIVAPIALHLLSAHAKHYWHSWQITLIGGAYCITTLFAAIVGLRQILGLAWSLGRPMWTPASSRARDLHDRTPIASLADDSETSKDAPQLAAST
jgi:hypothetical protein